MTPWIMRISPFMMEIVAISVDRLGFSGSCQIGRRFEKTGDAFDERYACMAGYTV